MHGSLELPNLCGKNWIHGMLSDVLVANDKKIFFLARTQYNFLSQGIKCRSGDRGQTKEFLLSA